MLFHLKLFLHLLIVPPASALCLAVTGLWLARRRPRLGQRLVVTAVALLWLLAMPAVAVRLARAAEGYPALDLARKTDAGALVILAGGARRSAAEYGGAPAPSPETLARVSYGAYAARTLGLPVLVTGTAPEAAAMQDALHRLYGSDPRWTDPSARDTYENARHSAALLRASGVQSIVLVTSANHMRRAVHEFEDAGLRVTAAPTLLEPPPTDRLDRLPLGLLPTISGLDRSEAALRELIGEAARPVMRTLHAVLPGG